MQDGQEKRSALNLVFSQFQGSREVKKLVWEHIILPVQSNWGNEHVQGKEDLDF